MSALPRAPSAKNAPERQAMPDDQLMLAYAQGDAAAFDVLYARHEGGLFRFVKRLLGARLVAQADEVFQDTWVRIISARDSFSPQGATWRTWAFTIAHNLAMDRLRVSGREVTLDAHLDDDTDPIPTLDRACAARWTPPRTRRPKSSRSGVPRAAACWPASTNCRPTSAPRSCCTTKTA
ncbi:sigma-70 family RNA polymerase sigma factor [Variovorax sp. E3]|uniref:sigma-70 family RNA polymerase sigma factor n=1 Tax=Variovorax sp. E3 TaxID=1914993 RepID=UPI0022B71D28|nr:sigma-70 family RNA polymerase sigma factor [Variovorax sp. E3]